MHHRNNKWHSGGKLTNNNKNLQNRPQISFRLGWIGWESRAVVRNLRVDPWHFILWNRAELI